MSRRTWFPDKQVTSQGMVEATFSFVTNNTANPDPTLFRGCGGLTGVDGGAGVANSGPSAIASITRTGVGAYLVTFADGYRYVTGCNFTISDAADQLYVRPGTVSNEGAGDTTPITMVLQVRSAATATESTGRRIYCTVVLKNSGNGT